jgi:hypothetical protein
MKWLFIPVLFFSISCSDNDTTEGSVAKEIAKDKWNDLTYDYSDETLYWPTANGIKLDTENHGITPAGYY